MGLLKGLLINYMKESYEVIMSCVAEEDLFALLKDLESHSLRVIEVVSSEAIGGKGGLGFNERLIDEFRGFSGDLCIAARLYGFDLISVEDEFFLLVRVVNYNGNVDVELFFDDVCISNIDEVMFLLQRYIQKVCGDVRMAEFYGGIEPAHDLSTRFFTNGVLGPLALSKRP